jgi:hypothetical protein
MKRFITLSLLILIGILSGCTQQNTAEPSIYIRLIDGVDTVELGSEWSDPGAEFIVLDKTYNTYASGSVNTGQLGVYKIVYSNSVNDQLYEAVRYVSVVDQTPPTGSINPGLDTITLGEIWVNAGISVSDNSGGSVHVEIIESINLNMSGVYHVEYILTDQSGNESIVTRVVTIIEDE